MNRSGQMLLVTVMIVCVVILISIPIVISMSHTSARTLVLTQQREKAQLAIREGTAYASHVLSSTTTWASALLGRCPPEFEDKVGEYEIACATPLSPADGQVRLSITAYGRGKEEGVLRQSSILFGRRTLAQANPDTSVPLKPAALQLFHIPTVQGELRVHWGSVLCYDATPWRLTGEMDRLHFPRKFSLGPILRSSQKTDTGDPDLFASTALEFAPVIDERAYQKAAKQMKDVIPPVETGSLKFVVADPPGSGYFYIEKDTAVFQAANANYMAPDPSAVYYIDGNAEFGNVFLDLREGGALIVKGNLYLRARAPTVGGTLVSLKVPAKAADEYPDEPMAGRFPGREYTGKSLPERLAIDLGGFIYVHGDLILEEPSLIRESRWVIAGALRVDGKIMIPPEAELTLYYDDTVGSAIGVTGSSIQVLSSQ